jgi:alpha-methylacyl-CoA racemase
MSGPLHGIKVVELAGIGPGPFAAMMLSDMGAEVIRVDRVDAIDNYDPQKDTGVALRRGRRSVAVDLKHPSGVEAVLRLVEKADALLEGFRPGVAERIGVGPEVALGRNPALVYGRMTGWGQYGPYAKMAGHDINYIALAGVLSHIGRVNQPPTIPLNIVGDFGGGGMLLAYGIVCGVLEARSSGLGQVIDAAMYEGAAVLSTVFHNTSLADGPRGTNQLDGGAHFYDVYETSDNQFVAIGAIEPKFYSQLIEGIGLVHEDVPRGADSSRWPDLKQRIAKAIKSKSREEWCTIFEGSDACFAPVLTFDEAREHPHARSRKSFVNIGGSWQPSPAPRFSRTQPSIPMPPALPGQHTEEVLRSWGFSQEEMERLLASGCVVNNR